MIVSDYAVMASSYDYSEVARSVLIAILASYAALDLAGRVTAASGWFRSAWLMGGAVAMGVGIWSMHFKGMLAFRLPVPVSYHWPTVLLSLLLAITVSAFALYVVSRSRLGLGRASMGSIIMGSGIAGMHYLGMAAMRLSAIMLFNPLVVILSIAFAIVFSLAALMLAFGLREETKGSASQKIASAVVMGAAVSAMHYTGMASVSFITSTVLPNMSRAGSISSLANNGIGIVTIIVLAAAMLTSSVDRRAEAKLHRLNEELEHRVIERTSQLSVVNKELEKLRDELRLVVDTIPQQIWSALPDGSVDFANQRWLEYFGLPSGQIQGQAWTDAIHPGDRANTITKWRAALARGEPFEFEARLQRADGEYRRFVTRGVPLRDQLGNIVKWYGTKTDVEDRRRTEEDLRESEKRLRAFFKNSPNLIFVKDPQGRYLYVNQEVERVLRITEEQIKGKRDDEVFTQEQAAAYQANDRQVLQAGIPMEFEEILLKEDGPHTTIVHKFPLFNAEGAIYAIGGVATDITEHIREEAALRYSEERYRIVVETANDAMVSIDQSGDILLANPATSTIFGYESSELIGQPLTILMPEYLRHLHEAGFKRYLDTGQRHINWRGVELIGLRKNGEEFPVEVSFWELTRNCRRVFTGFIRDISDRKRAEEALRRSEAYLAEAQKLSHTGSWAWDVVRRVPIYWSAEWYRITGLDPAEGPSVEKSRALHTAEEWSRLTEMISQSVKEKTDYETDTQLVFPDGSTKYIHIVGHVVVNPSGEVVELVGTVMDITERKRVDDELRRSEAYLAAAQALTHIGSWALDLSTGELYWSAETFRIFGFEPGTAAELRNMFLGRIHPDDRPMIERGLEKALTTTEPYEVEYRIVWADGSVRVIRESIHPRLGKSGEVIERYGVVADITERKRAEEELRRLSSQLLRLHDEERRNIARDLHDTTGQDLVALSAMVSQLHDSLPSTNRKFRKMAAQSLALAENCVREIRTLSYVLYPAMLDKTGLQDAIQHYLQGFTKRANIDVKLDISPQFGRVSRDTEVAFFRVIQESLTNIQRHSGSSTAQIRLLRHPEKILLEVIDKGRGIRGDHNQPGPTSEGVGIPSMRERVKRIGGDLQFETSDRGTIVRVTVPTDEQETA